MTSLTQSTSMYQGSVVETEQGSCHLGSKIVPDGTGPATDGPGRGNAHSVPAKPP